MKKVCVQFTTNRFRSKCKDLNLRFNLGKLKAKNPVILDLPKWSRIPNQTDLTTNFCHSYNETASNTDLKLK